MALEPWLWSGQMICVCKVSRLHVLSRLQQKLVSNGHGCSVAMQGAESFQKLYPEQYLARFLADGIRPDGRTLGRARATTIGLGAVTSADGSALVRVGHTTVLAGIKLDLIRTPEDQTQQGQAAIHVELAPFSTADWRPGRPHDMVSTLTERLSHLLLGYKASEGILDLTQLCIEGSKSSWSASLEVYVLNLDGSVFDVAAIAMVAALHDMKLPPVTVSKEGHVERIRGEDAAAQEARRIQLRFVPVSLTCNLYKEYLIADPTAEEEAIANTSIVTVLDAQHRIHGLYKSGGPVLASQMVLNRCIEIAKLRYKEVTALLQQALEAQMS